MTLDVNEYETYLDGDYGNEFMVMKYVNTKLEFAATSPNGIIRESQWADVSSRTPLPVYFRNSLNVDIGPRKKPH